MGETTPYHPAANPEFQLSGQIGADPLNLEAMAKFVRALGSTRPSERFEVFADELVIDDWMEPGERLVGKADVVSVFFDPVVDAFDDYVFEVHETIISGSSLVVLGHFTGRFVRSFVPGRGKKPIPPTGERVRWTARDIYHFRDGRIVRIQYANDTLTVARQLGAIADDSYPW